MNERLFSTRERRDEEQMTNFANGPWEWGLSNPERAALRCGDDDRWTYGRLQERIAEFAGALREAGVGPDHRVILIAPTVPEFAVAYFGILAAGATAVGMNPMATPFEIDYVLEDAEVSLLVAWHECADAGASAAASRGIPCWEIEPGAERKATAPLEEPVERGGEETAVILYTSGTTGSPKGAELTHANLAASSGMFGEAFELTADDVFGTALPLFHVFGGSVILGTALLHGASVDLLPRFKADDALRLITSGRLTIFQGVPTMYNAMLQEPFENADFSSLRFCSTGGAALPTQVLSAFEERFGVVILEGYGLTETTAAGTFTGLHRPRKPGYSGIAAPGMEVRIVDPAGAELPRGGIGEVIVRGPQIMKGYYGRPEATAEAIRDGWFHSGDLGTMDADGDVRIVDRVKDLVIRGGYNVYPQEVEQVLYVHPDVVEAAVLGVEDEHFGEEIVAVLALREGAAEDPGAFYEWAKQRLSAYKVPRRFQFVESLPKGTTGKILKRKIVLDDLRDGRPARA
jgi:long-chain acyl-CoA synthetase